MTSGSQAVWESTVDFSRSPDARRDRATARLDDEGLLLKTRDFERRFLIGQFRVKAISPYSDIIFDFPVLKREYGSIPEAYVTDPALAAMLKEYGYMRKNDYADLGYTPAILIAGALLLLIVLFFTYGLTALSGGIASLIPREAEASLGKVSFEQAIAGIPLDTSEHVTLALQKCTRFIESLPHNSGDQKRQFTIVLADKDINNAFALPGGYIVIYRGILKEMEDEGELLGLLLHEAGHVYLQHGLKRVTRSAIVVIGLGIMFGDVGGLSGILIQNAGSLLDLSYSRHEEAESDAFAVEMLKADGRSVTGLATLFRKISGEQQMPQWASFLTTHPAAEERISFFESAALGYAPKNTTPLLTEKEWMALTHKSGQ